MRVRRAERESKVVTLNNWLTTQEFADEMNLEINTVGAYCRLGRIKATKKGIWWMIPRSEMKRWHKEARRVRGRAPADAPKVPSYRKARA